MDEIWLTLGGLCVLVCAFSLPSIYLELGLAFLLSTLNWFGCLPSIYLEIGWRLPSIYLELGGCLPSIYLELGLE